MALEIPIEIDPNAKKIDALFDKWGKQLDKMGTDIGKKGVSKLWAEVSHGDRNQELMGFGVKAASGAPVLGDMGAMVGEAMGGPVGAQIGKMIAEKIPELIAAPAKMFVNSLQQMSDSLNSLQGQLGPVDMGFDLITSGLKAYSGVIKSIPIVGELLGPLLDALTAIPGIIKQITHTLVSFAEVANPAMGERLNDAVRDVQGVIGRAFLPLLELLTDAIREFGNIMADIMPTSQEIAGALSPLKDAFASMGQTLREYGPEIRAGILITVRLLANVMSFFLRVLTNAVRVIGWLARQLGFSYGGHRTGGSSWGAAGKPAQFEGFEDYERRLQAGTLSQGAGASMDAVPRDVEEARSVLEDLRDWMMNGGLTDAIVRALPGGGWLADRRAAEQAKEGAVAAGIGAWQEAMQGPEGVAGGGILGRFRGQ